MMPLRRAATEPPASSTEPAAPTEPDANELTWLRELLSTGRTLDAYAACGRFAPFETWRSLRGAGLAAGLVTSLGAPKRGLALRLGALRHGARSTARETLRASMRCALRGPVDGLRVIRAALTAPEYETASDDDRASLHEVEGLALGALRDFEGARRAFDRAAPFETSLYALAICRARIALAQDRYDEALALARAAHALRPLHPDIVLFVAHLYEVSGAADDALSLVRAAAETTQSAELAGALATLLEDRKAWDERAFWVEQWAARAPLLEDVHQLAGMRSDAAYDRGDHAAALALARTIPTGVHARVAEHLAAAAARPDAKRVTLDVPFVRQHHMTCAPATLTAIASYWGIRAEHLEVANAICYDGTPSHSERSWAETHGFAVRGFTATWDSVRAVLDRGVPMTVVTATAASAHLQAIVGYDERRGTLFLRDPFLPRTLEALAEEWLATWRATGPLAMAMAPEAERARLDGLALPDEALHDLAYATNAALARHDRAAGVAARDALVASDPEHMLAVAVRRAVAAYDGDVEGVLACAQALAARSPDFAAAHVDALWCMRTVRPRRELLALSESLYAGNRRESLYAEELARDLAGDAREHPRAARLLRRAMAARPDRHGPVRQLADVRWSQRAFDEALDLHRIAACLGSMDESAAWGYFEAARALGRADEALAHLHDRHGQLGPRNARPSMTLYKALDALGRSSEGLGALDEALAAHATDGALLLFVAEARASLGALDAAHALLAKARPFAKEAEWLSAAAHLALRAGDTKARATYLETLVALEPLNVMAHYEYAGSLAASAGAAASRAHLEGAWAKAPHHRGLAQACLMAARGAGPGAIEATARRAIDLEVADAAVHAALGRALAEQGRLDEARVAIDTAARLEPNSAPVELARFAVLDRAGDRAAARAALFRALTLEPDWPGLVPQLLVAHGNGAERDAALERAFRVVARASVTGVGISGWVSGAEPSRDPQALLATVEQLRAERPGLLAVWICAARERSRCGDDDGARALADEACTRFPLAAEAFASRARAYAASGRTEEALLAFERASELALLDEGIALGLVTTLRRHGVAARAREALTRAIGRMPASALLRRHLAELEFDGGNEGDARAALDVALALAPDENASYALLDRIDFPGSPPSARDGGRTVARLEALALERPWSADLLVTLARTHARRNDGEAAISALERALRVEPRMVEAHELYATFLALVGRIPEALAASLPASLADDMPRELRGRHAWVLERSGDRAAAIEAMRALVTEHPGYLWASQELASWLVEDRKLPEAIEILKASAATCPDAVTTHLQLGHAYFEIGDGAAGKRALVRATQLAEDDPMPWKMLFGRAIEEGDVEGARATLEPIRARSAKEGHVVALCEGRLGTLEGDVDLALRALRKLARDAAAPSGYLGQLRYECISAGFGSRADELFGELLFDPEAVAEVGAFWAGTRATLGELARVGDAIAAIGPRTAESPTTRAVAAAAHRWLVHLRTRDGRERYRAAYLLSKNVGRVDDALWGEIGCAFAAGSASEDAVQWMRDWRERPDAYAGSLAVLASCLRDVARVDEALEVNLRGAALPTTAGVVSSHKPWAAFELAMRGRRDEAAHWLWHMGDLSSEPYLQSLERLARATVVAGAREKSLYARLTQIHPLLTQAKLASPPPFLERARERAERRIALELGPFTGTVFRHRAAVLTVVVTALILGALVFGRDGVAEMFRRVGHVGVLALFFGARMYLMKRKQVSK